MDRPVASSHRPSLPLNLTLQRIKPVPRGLPAERATIGVPNRLASPAAKNGHFPPD